MKEYFKDVKGYKGLYRVSNLGRVKSLSRFTTVKVNEKILKSGVESSGYLIVGLSKNGKQSMKRIHQLVAIAFLNHEPNGQKTVVDHVDNNQLNNNVNNLQLITNRENCTKDSRKSIGKFIGVNYRKDSNSWFGGITYQGKKRYTKSVKTEEEAYSLYKVMLNELNLVNYNKIC